MENSGKKIRRAGGREGGVEGLREWQRGPFELERVMKGLWKGKGREGHCEMLNNLTIDGV